MTTTDNIDVRRAQPDDLEEIGRFIKRQWSGRSQYKWPSRWRWQFETNPYKQDELPVWIAISGGRIVGQTGGMLVKLKYGDTQYPAAWSTDTIVDPDLRGRGIGSRLQKALHESFQICMSLAMTEPNRRIKAKLGARPIQPLPILVRRIKWTPNELASALLRRSPQLFRGAFRYGLNLGVGSLFTKVLNLSYKRSLSKFESNIEFTSVRRFGVETDALWDRIERNFPIAVVRDAEYLNWKYVDQPDIDHNSMLVKDQGTLIGILILREPDISGNSVISEIIMDPNDGDLAAVIAHVAVETLAGSGASRVTAATSISTFVSALERVGFNRRGEVVGMFCRDGSIDNPSLAYEKNAWLLSRADHDWDAGGQLLSDAYS